MKIMTGKTGTPHVTSQQFRQLIEGTVGQESYILTSGENLEPELQTNNLLKIRSGMMSHHGNLSVVDLGTYDEVTIQNGTQGMQRIDLVVNRYTQDEETGIEKNEWIVIQGTPAASNPQVPAYTEGNLQESDLVDDCPVFEVHLNGINVTEVVKLLDVVPNISELNGNINNGTKELWALHSPGWMMADGSTLTLPEPISKQKNGIILVWSRHDPDAGSSLNYGWNYSYIPKDSVAQGDSNNGHNFFLSGESLGYVASKYLYISDTQIVGSTNNAVNNVTGSGITTRNRNFALRQVLAY